MYKPRRDRYGTLRVDKFRGLNKADNPRNIEDGEFSDMLNLYLEKDGTIKSRLGWTRKCSNITASSTIRGVHKTTWEDAGDALYVMGTLLLYKVNESTWGSEVILNNIIGGGEHVQFERYRDKVLFLAQGKPLLWINSDDDVSGVSYPSPKADMGAGLFISTQAGGSLEQNTYYQYCVSYKLGENYRDGETIGSLPADMWTNVTDPKTPPPVIMYFPESHPYQKTTDTNKTLVATNQPFSCTMNGYDIGIVSLYRRKVRPVSGSDSFSPITVWALIDEAFIHKTYDGEWVYEFESNTMAGEDNDGEPVGVITDITGTYNTSTDVATIYVDFTDNGTVEADESYVPRGENSEQSVYAKYMARLNNRVLLANITNHPDDTGKRMVYFSYRGYTPLGNDENPVYEIPGYMWPYPMLIFPPDNFFYCEKDNLSGEITGIHTYQDNVLIFTDHQVFLWREGMIDPIKLSDSVGCIANDTIREFEGKLLWLDRNGVYQYDGSKVKNLTYEKVNPYIEGISSSVAYKASATIYDRKYYLSIPYQTTSCRNVLIYDFDLGEWYHYRYRYNDGSIHHWLYIDYLFTHHHDSDEDLYAGIHYSTSYSAVGLLEYGDSDYWPTTIPISFRTKNYTLGAPDIEKAIRRVYINLDNYSGGASLSTYVGQTDLADNTVTLTASEFGFLVNESLVNEDSIENASEQSFAISLPQGLDGTSFQLGLSTYVIGSPLTLKSFGIDWLTKRKLPRTIGG